MNQLSKNESLEKVYTSHHGERRGDFFMVEGDKRGFFLKKTIGKNKKVLDIGCRDGALTSYYAKDNEVFGVDIDREAIKRAEEKYHIKTAQVDLNGLWKIEKNYFDVVVAAEVLEHLYNPQIVISKVKEVLNKDGMFVGSIPHAFAFQHRLRYLFGTKKNTPVADPTHINHFTFKEFREILESSFEDVSFDFIISPKFKIFFFLPKSLFAFGFLFKAQFKK